MYFSSLHMSHFTITAHMRTRQQMNASLLIWARLSPSIQLSLQALDTNRSCVYEQSNRTIRCVQQQYLSPGCLFIIERNIYLT